MKDIIVATLGCHNDGGPKFPRLLDTMVAVKRYRIELISPGVAIPVGFTVSLTGLLSLIIANGDWLVGEKKNVVWNTIL